MWSALILETGPLRAALLRTPTRTRNRERRHGTGRTKARTLNRRLLVLEAQRAERQRRAPRMAADPQHGHAGNLRQERPTGNLRIRL
jgi:hypothetical protein